MKRIFAYFAGLCAALSFAACSTAETDELILSGDNGAVTLTVAGLNANVSNTAYDPTQLLDIRIYNSNSELLRHYTSEKGIPERFELLKGTYRIVVEAGESVPASFEKRFYVGEEYFNVTAGQTTKVEVPCTRQNVSAKVSFDQSVIDNLTGGYYAEVALGETVGDDTATKLRYSADNTGYYILPEGVASLAWSFNAFHPEKGQINKSGKISGLKAGENVAFSFRFSPDLPGYIELFNLRVEDPDQVDDTIIWADITIEAEGFNAEEQQNFIPGTTDFSRTYNITNTAAIANIRLELNGEYHELLTESINGITINKTDDRHVSVTFTQAFFEALEPGMTELALRVKDSSGGEMEVKTPILVQGIMAVGNDDFDLWYKSVTLQAAVADESASVNFTLRDSAGVEQQVEGTAGANGIYTATFVPTWNSATNEKGYTYYTPDGKGIRAGESYTIGVKIGEASYTKNFVTEAGVQIPDGDMENSALPCYTEKGSETTTFWGSGNNGIVSNLCTWATAGSNHYTVMQSTGSPTMAAGNLFTGTFKQSGMGGTVSFGQPYTFNARPKALRLKYHAQIGTVDINKGNGPLAKGDQDCGRIFVAIVEWNTRHQVTSTYSLVGTSTNSGVWGPENGINSVSEGRVIGYASLFLEETTAGSDLVSSGDLLNLYWYDYGAAAPTTTYSLVISCAANAYGDFFNGCSTNHLYVDDFEWVY